MMVLIQHRFDCVVLPLVPANFEIHEDAQGRVFVKDLSLITVTSREEVDALIQSGLKLRATHETKMNAVSSRSHTVFTIHVFQQSKRLLPQLIHRIAR